MGRLRWMLLGSVCAGILTGCGGAGAPDQKTVAASLLTKTHIFYQDMVAAMEEEAKARGLNLRIQYAEFDSPRQHNHIDTFIAQGADAILVAPTDSSEIAPAIEAANAAGIPVFTVDIAAHDAEVVCHIASDNEAGGRMLAEYLVKQLDGSGKIAIIDHPTVASVQERTKGFLAVVDAAPGLEVVQRAPGMGQRDKAMRAAEDVLQAHPDLDAIFGINDDSALGALAAVESAGLENDIIIVGFDGTPEARTVIGEGKALKADAVQYPGEIGQVTIQTIAEHLEGKPVPKVRPVKVGLIDMDAVNALADE